MTLRKKNIIHALLIISIILFVNIILSSTFWRWDLTSDKRYTLNEISKTTIKQLDDFVFVRVYLDGEMPVEFKKLRNSIKEELAELQIHAPDKFRYEFVNPMQNNENERNAIFQSLREKGIEPFTVQVNDDEGGATQRLIFPSALITYMGKEKSVNFLKYNDEILPDENINIAYQNIEFELISTINLLTRKTFPNIAFIEGHGELDAYETGSLEKELSQFYTVNRLTLDGNVGSLDSYKVVIVAQPKTEWDEADKLVIDQYIMNGGSVAWFIDEVNVNEDSLAIGEIAYAVKTVHNLDDMLFRYGARLNANLIQDLQCSYIPVNIAPAGSQANFQPSRWMYYPLLFTHSEHLATKGLNLVLAKYASSIDFVGSAKSNLAITKTPLLYTSYRVKETQTPTIISLRQINDQITGMELKEESKVIAAMYEGTFESIFKNRVITHLNNNKPFKMLSESKKAKMLIVSDANIIKNDVVRRASGITILPLGFDRYLQRTFGNMDFAKNAIMYLAGDELLAIRSHNVSLRLLDKEMTVINRNRIIIINTLIPPLAIILFGIIFTVVRKRKNAKQIIR